MPVPILLPEDPAVASPAATRLIPYALSASGDRIFPDDLDAAGKATALLQLRCPMCSGSLTSARLPGRKGLTLKHHGADSTHREVACPWYSGAHVLDSRVWDAEGKPALWRSRLREPDTLGIRLRWADRGAAELQEQLVSKDLPVEVQRTLAKRRDFLDFIGLTPRYARSLPGKDRAVDHVLKQPRLDPASPLAHVARIRGLAELLILNPSYGSTARSLWWLSAYLVSQACGSRQRRPQWLHALALGKSADVAPYLKQMLESGSYREDVQPILDTFIDLLELFPFLDLTRDDFVRKLGSEAARRVAFVYLMRNPQSPELVKVGHASDVAARRRGLSNGQAHDYIWMDTALCLDFRHAEPRIRSLLAKHVGTGRIFKEHVELRPDVSADDARVFQAFAGAARLALHEDISSLFKARPG